MPLQDHKPIPSREKISVGDLVKRMKAHAQVELSVCAGANQLDDKFVVEADLHRPGLALAGFIDLFTYKRIQIIGNTECEYLSHLSKDDQLAAFRSLTSFDLPTIILTDNNKLPKALLQRADEQKIPVLRTKLETTQFMFLLRDFLDDYFALQTLVHGTMVDVYGIGILITGKSGIGKSEVALDLLERGHRLVSDDAVMLTKKGSVLLASATEINKHFMEIRGLGIIDIMSMFGIRAIRYQKRLEVVLQLSLWDETEKIERTGLNHDSVEVMGSEIPLIHLPITPGKNITVITEVIAMNYLLKHYGYDAAEAFQQKVKNRIKEKKSALKSPDRAIEYFEGDYE
ncbi:MAG: HPr(Ser) kinase/phosphatase [Balneolaceae bacterium]